MLTKEKIIKTASKRENTISMIQIGRIASASPAYIFSSLSPSLISKSEKPEKTKIEIPIILNEVKMR